MTADIGPAATRLTIFGPLRWPRFRRMVSARLCSELGDGVTSVALPLYVYARTASRSPRR